MRRAADDGRRTQAMKARTTPAGVDRRRRRRRRARFPPLALLVAVAVAATVSAASSSSSLPFDLCADDDAQYSGRVISINTSTNTTSTWAGANAFFLHALPPRERDRVLDAIKDAGFRVVRIFLQAHAAGLKNTTSLAVPDVEPLIVGEYDPSQLRLVDALMVACAARGLKLNIALHNRYSLGCWRTDAYAAKYALPRAKGELCNPPQQSDAAAFYTSPSAAREIDARFAFILAHRNALMGERRWSQLREVVLGFDVQNESQTYLPGGVANPSWVCDRARALRHVALGLDPRILVITGGGALVTDSALPEHFACPWIDVVAIHSYSAAAWEELLPCVVRRAERAGKRVIAQEFGAKGNNAAGTKAPGLRRQIDAIEASGVPWMVWQVSAPNLPDGEEVWKEDAAAWALLRSRARGAGRLVGRGGAPPAAFAWPELAP